MSPYIPSLRRRCNFTPVGNVCEAASISLLWAPNGLNLPEMRFEYSFNLIGFFNRPIMAGFKSWYTGGGPEHDFGYERPSIDDQDHYRHFDRGFRSVVENEDLYGRNYRLINENHDRYYPKGVTKNTVALVKRKVGDEHSRSKELKRRSVDW